MQPERSATAQPPCVIVVMGVSGSGKSTLGRRLAALLGCTFEEGDDYHSAASVAKMRAGHPLNDDDRWPWLDRIAAAAGAAAHHDGRAIVACSALRRAYRERLATAAALPLLFVLMDAPRDVLAQRLAGRRHHFMPVSLLASQLATLERPGSDERVLVLDACRPTDELCRQSIDWITRMMQVASG